MSMSQKMTLNLPLKSVNQTFKANIILIKSTINGFSTLGLQARLKYR